MNWLDKIIKIAFDQKMKKLNRSFQDPVACQQQTLKRLISNHKNTEWGQSNHLKKVRDPSSFKKKINIHHYEDFEPYIQQMIQGKSNVLSSEPVHYFSKSSGTSSSKSKFIPVPYSNLKNCHLNGAHVATAMWLNENPSSRIFNGGNAIIMGGKLDRASEQAETFIGDISAIMLKYLPFYATYFLVPDKKTALLPDWEYKIARIAEAVQQKNITNLSGVPSWSIILMNKILDLSPKESLKDIFPNFELFMHGGVDMEAYKIKFNTLFEGKKIAYRNVYNATEGFFAVQSYEKDLGMTLLIDNDVYYEFIRLEDYGHSDPQTLDLSSVQLGVNYVILISSSAGLWRYVMGDTIQFTSLQPHKLIITGRTQQFINSFGEELMVSNTNKAIAMTNLQLGTMVNEYMVAPFIAEDGTGHHIWLVEFENEYHDPHAFIHVIDSNLKKLNSDYESKRNKDILLKKPIIHSLSKGTFYKWMSKRGKLGGQNKIPRLTQDLNMIEDILALKNSLI